MKRGIKQEGRKNIVCGDADMARRKTTQEKLQKQAKSEIKATSKGRMLIPASKELRDAVRAIPRGRVATVEQLRQKLAEQHNADYACPLVTGIFLRLLAEATEEGYEEWSCPWWRVVEKDGKMRGKYPAAPYLQAERLRGEGVQIAVERGKPRVADLNTHLAPLSP